MTKRYMKPYSTLVVIRKVQYKTTVRYFPTHVRMTSKRQESKHCQGCGEGKSFCTAGGNVNWYSYYGK